MRTGEGEPATVAEVDVELESLRRLLPTLSTLSRPALLDQIDGLLDRRSKLTRAARRAEKVARRQR